jgi:hypothetical protein
MAYDEARDRLVVIGGDQGNGLVADVWEWDGSRWMEVSPR